MGAIRICKVCGKEYPYCTTRRYIEGIFRWQDVACSPEHGSIYLSRIRASRGEAVEEPVAQSIAPEFASEQNSGEDNELSEEDDYDEIDEE